MTDSTNDTPAESRWARVKEDWQQAPARLAERQPHWFLAGSIALTLIGYALPLLFPIAAISLLFAISGALLEGGINAFAGQWSNFGLLAFCGLMTVSLWRLRVGAPSGEPLTEQQVPALYAAVDEIRTAFKAPAINDIHLSDEAGLTVHRVPRTGYPFMYRHVLVVGMPVLHCMSLEQFKCLLAGCIGELSSVRTDAAGWITQTARSWHLFHAAVAGKWTPAALLYRAFLAWYAPLLDLVVSHLDGGHRLQRDHYALEVANDDLVVEMIAGEIVMKRFLQEIYWPTVYRTTEHSSTPNFKVYRNMESVFRHRISADDIQVWVRDAFVGKWLSDDSDPGLKARLREVGHSDIHYTRPDAACAATTLLGASYQWIVDRCDVRWAEEHREEWAERHIKTQRQYGRLDMLRDVLKRHGLRGEEAMEYAALVKRYCSAEEAMEAYETILELNPNDSRINFGVGKYMLSVKDARGVKILEHAMAMDKRFVDPACRLISGFVVNNRLQDTVRKFVDGGDGNGKKRDVA